LTHAPRDPDIVGDSHARRPPGSLTTRLVWFAALWLAGLAAVSAIALAIRAMLR
jgi:hypothetical protein